MRVAFSPDGKRSTAMYGDGSVGIWDGVFETEQPGHASVGGGTPSDVLLFSPDGKQTARSFVGGVIRVSTGNVGFSLSGKPALSAAFSPDGRIIAAGTTEGTVEIWDLYSKQELLTLRGHTGQVTSVAFAPDGRTLATVSNDGTLRLWRAYKDRELEYEEAGAGNRRWGLPPP
jgi:WD40 repeat protein